ncbi:M23 family metallopeptidase [Verrucomicrobiaceae bacterium N1E253]|uniref:M23 family metallopeptidase n=1 Tax=Oceaniferula marina TaxID=2748318 RepID=A0A851GFY4_9BACT|nr:M23 family metallopeptidase [Oceaniferula marina]NWK56688.1 M23 family metallopeptidase [Oceaniferula marina]
MTSALTLRILTATLLTAILSPAAGASETSLKLPTVNEHLYGDDGSKFYMWVPRVFEGKTSRPWTAGKYGFVRTLRRTEDGVIGTKFHEGIDIKPIKRDRSQNPLDAVNALAAGTVAYVNPYAGNSNYGKYVVVKHNWQSGPIYSLYAHLSTTEVKTGQVVKQGQKLGKMGYTGRGINRERSHVHLELDLMISSRFNTWHNKSFGSKNHHGLHNGLNMSGMDIAELLLQQKKNPNLTIPAFFATIPVYYKITVPRKGPLEIVQRYPWMAKGDHRTRTPSWEISFSQSGLPLAVSPSKRSVPAPRVTSVKKCLSKHEYHTKGLLTGTGHRASLTRIGLRYLSLVTGEF